jgi:type II secretory ATPase GspE/PulE/Tfp pilus assembly ATPase PilB-like protein
VGCHACGDNGYNGRISLAEIIRIEPELRNLIDSHQPTLVLKQYLKKKGTLLMRQDGLAKARAGLTTLEEVGRVIQLESDTGTADA